MTLPGLPKVMSYVLQGAAHREAEEERGALAAGGQAPAGLVDDAERVHLPAEEQQAAICTVAHLAIEGGLDAADGGVDGELVDLADAEDEASPELHVEVAHGHVDAGLRE